jgi:predicted dehydrogenase
MWAPQLENTEALKRELEYFVDCITNDRTPINDGKAGWRVVRMLEAANQSVKNKGAMVELCGEELVAA